MYQTVVDGVIKKLNEQFPKIQTVIAPCKYELDSPYFEVGISEAIEKPVNGQRYLRIMNVFVNYYLKSGQSSLSYYQVLSDLMNHLELLSLDDGTLLKGSSRMGTLEKECFKFLVVYQKYFIKDQKKEDLMEEIKF